MPSGFSRERHGYSSGEIVVSTDASVGTRIGLGDDLQFSLGDQPQMAISHEADESVTVDSADGLEYLIEAYDDGSVAVTTSATEGTGVLEFDYPLESPGATHIKTLPNGAVLYLDSDGALVFGAAPPWAKDAEGRPLETWYEASGTKLSQKVAVTADTRFPVTADPWLGRNIFRTITVDSYKGQPRVNLTLSAWGWAVYSGGVAGQYTLNTAGWSEALAWNTTVRRALEGKATMKQQFECHALGALFAGEWNLERFRPSRTTHWSRGVGTHRCNWTTATYN